MGTTVDRCHGDDVQAVPGLADYRRPSGATIPATIERQAIANVGSGELGTGKLRAAGAEGGGGKEVGVD